MRRTGLALLGSLVLCASSGGTAGADAPTTVSFTLENGLRVLLHPIEGARGAFVLTHFTFGEEADPPGKSGLARVMSGLYATCAAGATPARSHGGVLSAYANHHHAAFGDDYSFLCHGVPANGLRAELTDAAARLGDLKIQASDFERERSNVLALLAEEASPSASTDVMWRHGVDLLRPLQSGGRRGGITAEVAALQLSDVQDQWTRAYKPRNALLVVAGRFDPALAEKGIRRQFSNVPPGQAVAEPKTAAPAAKRGGGPLVLRLASAGGQMRPSAFLMLDGPPSLSSREVAALLILKSRLQSAENAPGIRPDPVEDTIWHFEHSNVTSSLQQMGLRLPDFAAAGQLMRQIYDQGRRTVARFDPLEGTDGLFIGMGTLERFPTAETSIEALRARLRAAAEGAPTSGDRRRARGVRPPTWLNDDDYPCDVAIGIARRAQRGIDGDAVFAAIEHVTAEDLASAASRPTAEILINPADSSPTPTGR